VLAVASRYIDLVKMVASPTCGRVSSDDANYAVYRQHLQRTTDEPVALFLPG